MLTAILALCGAGVTAQTADDTITYVLDSEMPDAGYFLPQPTDTAGVAFIDDMLQFQWGKTQRNTTRGKQASDESLWTPDAMRSVLQQVLKLDTISPEKTPAMSRLLERTYDIGDRSTMAAKSQYGRKRPFMQMNDPLWAEYDTDFLRTNGSYPSGHTAFGWAVSLVFAEMWPPLQDQILRRGFQFGENRIITGAHYQSDVTAGYLCACAAVARAHTNSLLEEDIQAARAEYAMLKGFPAEYDPVTGVDMPHGEFILNEPVDTTSYRYITDVLRYWDAKSLRDTPRGKQAEREAEYSLEMMYSVFGEAMNITISPEKTPAICALIGDLFTRASDFADRLKPIRFRKRPFVQLGEPSFVAGDEEKERGKSSFPSGHTNLGWTMALTLAEVAPECQDEVLRRGYEYGYNRLIVGYHWFTDIEATRPLSSALIARLHANPSFRKLIQDARNEYLSITNALPTVTYDVKEHAADDAAYTIDGRPAAPGEQGIIIQGGKKRVVR